MKSLQFPRLSALVVLALLAASAAAQEEPPPQLRYFEGPEAAVLAVAYDPAGQTIAAVDAQGILHFWDAATGEPVAKTKAHAEPGLSLAAAPQGRWLASGGRDGLVNIFDLPTVHALMNFAGLNGPPTALAASHDGSLLLTGDQAKLVRLWNTANAQAVRDFGGSTEAITDVALLEEAKSVLAAAADGSLRGWNSESGEVLGAVFTSPSNALAVHEGRLALAGRDGNLRLLQWPPQATRTLASHGSHVKAVVISGDGQLIIAGGLDKNVHLFDAETGEKIRSLSEQPGQVLSLALHEAGKLIAAGHEVGNITISPVEEGPLHSTLAGHAGAVTAVDFHADPPLLASAGADGTARVWRIAVPPTPIEGSKSPLLAIAATADGKSAVTGGAGGTVRKWNLAQAEQAWNAEDLGQDVPAVAVSADGEKIASGDAAGVLRLHGEDGAASHTRGAHAGPVSGIAFHPGGERMFTTGHDGTLKYWQLPLAAPSVVPEHVAGAQALTYFEAGSLLSATAEHGVRLFGPDGKLVRAYQGVEGDVSTLAVSPDKMLIAAGDDVGGVQLWNPADGTTAGTVAGHTGGGVQAIAFSPTAPQFTTGGLDSTVRMWHLPQAPQEVATHAGPVQAIAATADGKQLASGSEDGVVLWKALADDKPAAELAQHEADVSSLAVRPDGMQVASADATGIVQLSTPGKPDAIQRFGAHSAGVAGTSYDASNKLLATAGADGAVTLWNLVETPTQPVVKHEMLAADLVLSTDGKTAFSIGGDKTLRWIDVASNKETRSVELAAVPAAVTLSAKGDLLAVANEAGGVQLFNVADGKPAGEVAQVAGLADIAFAPDGTHFATAGADRSVRVWELPLEPRELAGHTGAVQSIAVSPDGKTIASAAADKTVRLWNVADGKAGQTLTHPAAVTALAWKADGQQLVTGAADNIVRVWNSADGKSLAEFKGHAGAVVGVAFTPSGEIASASADKTIKFWKIPAEGEEQAEPRSIDAHDQPLVSMLPLADGATLATAAADGRLRIWNAAEGKQLQDINHGAAIVQLAASRDGKLLAAAGKDGSLKTYTTDGKAAQEFKPLAAAASGLALNADGTQLAATSGGKTYVYDADGALREVLPDAAPGAIAFSSEPRELVLASAENGLRIQRTALARRIDMPEGEQPLTSLAYLPSGSAIAVADAAGKAGLFNLADGKPIREFAGATAAINDLTVTPDGSRLLAAGADKILRIWTVADGKEAAALEHPQPVRAVSFAATPNRAISAGEDGTLFTWDLASGKLVQRLFAHAGPVAAVAVTADGAITLSGAADGQIARSQRLDQAFVPLAHEGGVTGLAFLPTGQHFLTAGADKKVTLYDLKGAPARQLAAAEAPLVALAIRADGKQAAAVGEDKQLYLWNVDNGQLERKVMLPAAGTSLAYNVDGTRLAVSGADQRLHVYNPADGLLLEHVPAPVAPGAATFAGTPDAVFYAAADKQVRRQPLSLIRLLPGHTAAVTSLAYTPDGKALFSGSADKTVKHWNAETGEAVRSLSHAEAVTGVAVTADGTQVVSAGTDKTIRTWNLANGAAVTTITLAAPVQKLALAAEPGRLLTAGDDQIVRVWDLASGRELERWATGQAKLGAVAFSPDGTAAVVASDDKQVRRWQLGVERLVAADPAKLNSLAVLPDGSHVLTGGEDKLVKLWDLEGKPVREFAGSATPVRAVAVSPDGAQISAGGDPSGAHPNVYVWNAADAKLLQTIATPAGVTSVAYIGDKLAVTGADKRLRIYNPADGRLWQDWATPAVLNDLTAAGETLLAAGADNLLHRYEFTLQHVLTGHEGAISSVAFTPDGQRLVTAGADKTIRLWNAADGTELGQFTGSTAAVHDLAISSDGTLLAAGGEDKLARLWKLPPADAKAGGSWKPEAELTQPAVVRTVDFSADGALLAAAGDDNLVHVWDMATGTEQERLAGHTAAIQAVAISSDGRTVITGAADNTSRQHFPTVLATQPAHEGPLTDVQFSADGTQLFTAGEDQQILAWKSESLEQDGKFAGANMPVRSLATSADGRFLAAGGDDQYVRLWNVGDKQQVAETQTPAAVTSVDLSSDGRMLLAAGADNGLRNYALHKTDDGWALQLTHAVQGHTDAVTRVDLAGNDRDLFSVSADSTAKRWLAASPFPRHTLTGHTGPVYSLSYRQDGRLLASGSGDTSVRIWDMQDQQTRFELQAHERQVTGVVFHPGGKEVASVGLDGKLHLWDVSLPEEAEPAKEDEKENDAAVPEPVAKEPGPREPIATIEEGIEDGLLTVAYSRDANSIYAAGFGQVWHQWQLNGEMPRTLVRSQIGHNFPVSQLVVNRAGNERLATIDHSGKLFIWSTGGDPIFHQQLPARHGFGIVYSPNGQEIIAATDDERVIRVLVPAGAR